MIRAAFPRLAIGFFALGLSACTTLPNQTPWIEVLSKNFEIFSALEEAPSQQLADELELFRTIVETRTNATRLDSSVPTRIFVFDRQSSLASFGLDPSIPGMRENNVIVGALVEARPYFEKSLQLDPDDFLNQPDWAEYLHDLSTYATTDEGEARELRRQAPAAYTRSFRLDPSIPETYAMYGSTFLAEGEDPTR